jgi:hypothetical protein
MACSGDAPRRAAPSKGTGSKPGLELVDVEVLARGPTAVPQGEAMALQVSARNRGPRSVSVPIELELASPSGEAVPFYSTSIFASAGKTTTEDTSVTPAQWTAELGRFEVEAKVDGQDTEQPLGFDVGEPAVLVPKFDDVTAAAGLETSVPAATCGQFASGAAWADIEGDGDLDLLVTRLGDAAQLFVNDGSGHFADEAASRGVAVTDTNGASFADYDNDGDADLVLVRDASDLLLRNDGTGRFTDVSRAAGIGDPGYRGMSASWGDFDGDGDVDLYVTNYMRCTGEWNTEEEIIAQVEYFPDTLYRNDGDGRFSDVTAYLDNDPDDYDDGYTLGAGFAAAWFDYNGDNRPDLYLANDFVGPSPDHNRLWRNDGLVDGRWHFTDVSVDSGTAFFMNTMGIGVGDFDRDRHLDLALSNITANKLVHNDGKGAFVEAPEMGIGRPLQRVGVDSVTWGGGFQDLNLDGWEDLYFAAGNLQPSRGKPLGVQSNELFVNSGAGGPFLDVSAATGADDPGESKGVAFADYDRDGDVDLFVVNQGGEPHLFENVTPRQSHHWLEVDTVGTRSNRDGCGAALSLTTSDGTLTRQVSCGSTSVASGSQDTVHFGLGAAAAVPELEILWPSGARQTLTDVGVDRVVTVQEAP